MSVPRLCQGPGCDKGPGRGPASLEGRRPQTRACSERCQKRLERERIAAPGAEVLLERYRDLVAKVRRSGELTGDEALGLLIEPSQRVLDMLAEAEAA